MSARNAIIIFFCTLIAAADWKTMKIPNILTVFFFAALLAADMHGGAASIWYLLCSGAVLFVLFCSVYLVKGGMGFGDVKYAAVLGYALGFFYAVFACLMAAVLGLLFFLLRYSRSGFSEKIRRTARIPFAPFLSAGTLIILLTERWLL
jgi:prepilin signal peptidase PulO-like enzyme (type II secretory pathway)